MWPFKRCKHEWINPMGVKGADKFKQQADAHLADPENVKAPRPIAPPAILMNESRGHVLECRLCGKNKYSMNYKFLDSVDYFEPRYPEPYTTWRLR